MNEAPDSCLLPAADGLDAAITVYASPPRRTGSMRKSAFRASVVATGWTKSAVWMSPHFHLVMSSPICFLRSAIASSSALRRILSRVAVRRALVAP